MSDQFSRSLGGRIRTRRLDEARPSSGDGDPGGKLTQEALAALVDVSQPAVSGWEKGATLPTLAALVRLAEVLDTTVDELVGNDAPEAASA